MYQLKMGALIRRNRLTVSGAVVFTALFLIVISRVYAAGTPLSIAGYLGFHYGSAVKAHPTAEKPESKLWWHDGYWWGSLFSPADGQYRIHRYDVDSHNWVKTETAIDSRLDTRADVLWDAAANKLYIVSHVRVENPGRTKRSSNWAWLFRYSYDAGAKTYHLDNGFPVQTVNRDRTETVVLDKDSTGRLWVTYVSRLPPSSQYDVYVNVSTDDGLTWGTPFVLPFAEATVDGDDISSLIAFNDLGGPKIGVMWSNQVTGHFYFATHSDSLTANEGWHLETLKLPYPANDHINLASTASGQVLAAIKVIPDGRPLREPLVLVTARDVDASYSVHTVSLVADDDTRPIVVINEESNQAHVFATSKVGGGRICQWSAKIATPLAATTFPVSNCPPGSNVEGVSIVLGDATYKRINNTTSTKQRVNSTMNLLILAADDRGKVYVHNYLTQP
jgi:hypothetical protein